MPDRSLSSAQVLRVPGDVPATERPVRFDRRGPGSAPRVNNALLAIILFMGAEVMLFMGLLAALVLYKTASIAWPPPSQPMLPILVTFANTAVLLTSAVMMQRANASLRQGDQVGLQRGLTVTAILGTTFLAVQGFEWFRLVRQGLTLSSSMYGTTFYTLIGLHAAHVIGAVIWLLFVVVAAYRGEYSRESYAGVQVCGVYWYFVCALWVALFGVVYLA